MKASKTESQKKTPKKAEKKALEQSLTAKLFEAVKSLGHNAENIGEDLILVSKFVAKKISKRMKSAKAEDSKEVKTKKVSVPKSKTAKSSKSSKQSELQPEVLAKKAPAKPRPLEEPESLKVTKPIAKATKRAKAPAKSSKPNTDPEKGHIN